MILMITVQRYLMITQDDAKLQKSDENEGDFSGIQVYISRI